MPWQIDGTLYPDAQVPETLESMEEKVDFLARLCSAWDFGILPDTDTINEIRRPEWLQAVDNCRLLTSPTYHLVRRWHNLKLLPYLGQKLSYIQDDPCLKFV